jgi:hypothetical protein
MATPKHFSMSASAAWTVDTAVMLRAEPRARTRAVADRVRVVAVMMFLQSCSGFLQARLRLLVPLEKAHGDALQPSRNFSEKMQNPGGIHLTGFFHPVMRVL